MEAFLLFCIKYILRLARRVNTTALLSLLSSPRNHQACRNNSSHPEHTLRFLSKMNQTAFSDATTSTATSTSSNATSHQISFPSHTEFRYRRPANRAKPATITRRDTKEILFRVHHSAFGLKCKIVDPNEEEVFKHRVHLKKVSIINSPTNQNVLAWRTSGLRRKQCLVWTDTRADSEPVFEILGFLEDTYRIVDKSTGKIISTVRRKRPASKSSTYVIRIEAGVQTSAILSLVVSIDAVHNR